MPFLPDPTSTRFSRTRTAGADPRVTTLRGYLADVAGLSADAMVLVNVLEHIEDDAAFLVQARRVLEPAGRLLIFVPALPFLYGSLDRRFEHHRRYTRPTLRARLLSAGFRIRSLHYMNLPGALSWLLVGRVLHRQTLSPRQVATYDRWIVPWMVRLESLRPPPFGQSLIAVAEVAGQG
jgi:SAM-dependent methyltransferase